MNSGGNLSREISTTNAFFHRTADDTARAVNHRIMWRARCRPTPRSFRCQYYIVKHVNDIVKMK
jgi:hypothetical protein